MPRKCLGLLLLIVTFLKLSSSRMYFVIILYSENAFVWHFLELNKITNSDAVSLAARATTFSRDIRHRR